MLAPIHWSDDRLRSVCAPLSRQQLRGQAQQAEIDSLLDFVYGRSTQSSGELPVPRTVGLSACQVGVMKQISVVDMAIGRKNVHDIRVLINPSVVWESTVLGERVEGCVNFPEWWGVTRRPSRVKVSALDRWGNGIVLDVHGWAATLLSHEIDHLNGQLFLDRLMDPRHAHFVPKAKFAEYKQSQAHTWPNTIDVSQYTQPVFMPSHRP